MNSHDVRCVLLADRHAVLSKGCAKKEAPVPAPPPTVQVLDVAATNVPLHIEFMGQLDPPQNVEVAVADESLIGKSRPLFYPL